MNEPEYHATPIATAFESYLAFSLRTLGFNDVSQRGLKLLALLTPLSTHPFVAKLFGQQQQLTQALIVHHTTKHHVDSDFAFSNVLVLIASWAAFEAYVDDACKAMLQMDPTLVRHRTLAQVRLTQDEQQRDQAGQFDAYLRKGSQRCPGPATPVVKIEWQLGLVGLDGTVPPDLTDNINISKHVRNVWAHKAGKADQYFVGNCPGTALAVGDTVDVSRDSLILDSYGLMTYAILIHSRFRGANGLRPYQTPGSEAVPNPFRLAVEALFPNPISWDEVRKIQI